MSAPRPTHLTTRETLPHLRYATPEAAVAFLRKAGLRPVKRGRDFLWNRAAVEALVAGRGEVKP
jgi:hypothetical protein